jgi:small ligand-binding sensory domain FIST
MPFAAALATAADTASAVAEVCDPLAAALAGEPDLAFVFFSAHHSDAASSLREGLLQRLRPRCLLGCIAESVIGNDREVERGPALSLWAARWRQPVTAEPFHLRLQNTADGPSFLGWPDALTEAENARAAVLLLGDPYTFPADLFLAQMNDLAPGLRVLGGMASGIRSPGEGRLVHTGGMASDGAVGVLLQGAIGLRSIVSQGCRPVGRHFVITRGEENVIQELGGMSPLEQLQQLFQNLPPEEQDLFRQGFHVGLVIDEYRDEFQRGDFLVRNVLGVDRRTGALAINDRIRVGQTMQFHVRDAETADEDLHALLQLDLGAHAKQPAGALVFSCNGRGTRLFGRPDHDARAIRSETGAIPLAGFFAQGELGPIGPRNFIHGFTASVALFEE